MRSCTSRAPSRSLPISPTSTTGSRAGFARSGSPGRGRMRSREGVPFRFPSTPDTGPGLTAAGLDLLHACNFHGLLVDVSHLNEAGFWDVARVSQAPIVATHSNAHALSPSSRNLTDRQLDAIAESGGVVGVNFAVMFLTEDGDLGRGARRDREARRLHRLADRGRSRRVRLRLRRGPDAGRPRRRLRVAAPRRGDRGAPGTTRRRSRRSRTATGCGCSTTSGSRGRATTGAPGSTRARRCWTRSGASRSPAWRSIWAPARAATRSSCCAAAGASSRSTASRRRSTRSSSWPGRTPLASRRSSGGTSRRRGRSATS